MAVRRRAVYPNPDTGVVDRDDLFSAVAEALTVADFAGGIVTIVFGRAATGVPGEMVTAKAIVEWKSRADSRPQPEEAVTIVYGDPEVGQAALFEPTAASDEIDVADVEPLASPEEAPADTAEVEVDREFVPEAMR